MPKKGNSVSTQGKVMLSFHVCIKCVKVYKFEIAFIAIKLILFHVVGSLDWFCPLFYPLFHFPIYFALKFCPCPCLETTRIPARLHGISYQVWLAGRLGRGQILINSSSGEGAAVEFKIRETNSFLCFTL